MKPFAAAEGRPSPRAAETAVIPPDDRGLHATVRGFQIGSRPSCRDADLLVGLIVASVVWCLLQHMDLSPGNAVQNSRIIVLVGTLTTYSIPEELAPEAGIAAVATAGVLLGNADLSYEEEIAAFKGDLTLVVLSFVFVTLATLLSFSDLFALEVGGLVVVVVIVGVVRPLLVFLSTAGGRFTVREQWLMSAVAPRGIIPASVATLFAIQLRQVNEPAATALVGTLFLVILVTVVVQSRLARHVAQYLGVIPMRVLQEKV